MHLRAFRHRRRSISTVKEFVLHSENDSRQCFLYNRKLHCTKHHSTAALLPLSFTDPSLTNNHCKVLMNSPRFTPTSHHANQLSRAISSSSFELFSRHFFRKNVLDIFIFYFYDPVSCRLFYLFLLFCTYSRFRSLLYPLMRQ